MIDHISFSVKNFDESLKFYDETFAILGYKREFILEHEGVYYAGFGEGSARPRVWISSVGLKDEVVGKAQGVHFSFAAPSIKAVHAWHDKCIALGGTDNGAPGPREHYHPGYYGAFITDPNGWRIEACFHQYQK